VSPFPLPLLELVEAVSGVGALEIGRERSRGVVERSREEVPVRLVSSRPMPESSERNEPAAPGELLGTGQDETLAREPGEHERPQGMIPGRERRRSVIERGFVRIVATGGIVGIATILGAVLVSQDVAGWIVGMAVGSTSVILAAVLWSSRQL
jgi:hypothetical protein